jgi:hypothetical protein
MIQTKNYGEEEDDTCVGAYAGVRVTEAFPLKWDIHVGHDGIHFWKKKRRNSGCN